MGRVFRLSERSGERLKSRHRYCIIERSELEMPEVWRSEWNGERQSSGSALPIEASLSAS